MKKTLSQIEVEDVTVEKAIRKALKTLNAKENEVSVKVLKEGHKGLFRMKCAEHAKIRVTVSPKKK
jgi:predicted RNA-binding protein Jag